MDDREDLFLTHLTIVIRASAFPNVVIISVVVCLKCLHHLTLSMSSYGSGKAKLSFPWLLCSQWCACKWMHYELKVIFAIMQIIWRAVEIRNIVRYILSSVCLGLSPFSQSTMSYHGLRVLNLTIALLMVSQYFSSSLFYNHQNRTKQLLPIIKV